MFYFGGQGEQTGARVRQTQWYIRDHEEKSEQFLKTKTHCPVSSMPENTFFLYSYKNDVQIWQFHSQCII